MKRTLTLIGATLLAASPLVAATAQAEAVSPGKAQLAAEAGVNPTEYSTAQIIRLQQARQNDDAQTAQFILNHPAGNRVTRGE